MLDLTTNKMMVYDTEKYLLQPHIPGIVLSLYNTPHYTGIFFAILGRGPRAFQIGKISAVNH